MGKAAVKIKIMPESPSVNLKKLAEVSTKELQKLGAIINKTEEEPIAFGLKAVILTFAWPEEKDTSLIEDCINKIKNISSVQIIDYRRAFG